jgi:uncharacterized damage-inducible protein DinB
MKTESQRIYELLKNSWDGDMWHGPNLTGILKDIDWEKAFKKPAAGSHNIYELVQHMITWRRFVLEQLKGNESYRVELNSELDWPTIYKHSEGSWQEALDELHKNQRELVEFVKDFEDSRLEEIVPGRKFTWYTLLQGIIHHDIYHSAQISTLKK